MEKKFRKKCNIYKEDDIALINKIGNTAEVSAAVSMDSSGYRPQYGICPIVAISNN